ncbi:ABC-three component system middle component 8 [Vibrio europaeus]|uniref:ABC-three component system middle component 8 n=1 Tax=Vibrio europaeus TaxID=300876 RepID=UPI00233EB20C|nr:ABC-three component system middle component 8 [Vibrio europaeus]
MLLKPNKNANPDLTVMATSTFLLKRIKKNKVVTITDLRLALLENDKSSTPLLESSLEFLFLLGLIEYHTKNDLIEYTGS